MSAILKELSETEGLEYNIVRVRGIPQNPTFDADLFDKLIDNFETRDGDVFISTYVKAGTTWTQQILHSLLRNGEPGGKYGESVPWLEAAGASEFLGPREAPSWTMATIDAAPAPRYFKTHASVAHLPRGKANIKIIYVARNPKDTVVSLYHHAKSKPEFGYTGDFDTFCKIFLAGNAENGDWFDHCIEWWNVCMENPTTHLFLQYEDIVDDTPKAIHRINSFIGRDDISDEIMDKIMTQTSISYMQKHANIGINHLRKGGYGGWRTDRKRGWRPC